MNARRDAPIPTQTGDGATIAHICVYCGSGAGTDPLFARSTDALGRLMAEHGIGLVYGGGNLGLMGRVARAVLAHGGHVTGIIPEFLTAREKMLTEAQETIVVADMHARKQMMFDKADAFVALPGGIGTLEEVVEQMTWAQLGRHSKPILLLNLNDFWKPLLVLFAHMRELGFIRPGLELNYIVADRVEDVIPMLTAARRHGAGGDETALIEARF